MAFNAALSRSMPGFRFEVSIVDRSGRVQNFYALETDIVNAMKDAQQQLGESAYEVAYGLTPKDTWFMADHLRLQFTPERQGFELGWQAEDFFEANLPFYPPYVVFGTRFMAGRDPLTPAYEQMRGEYEEKMRALVSAALERRRAV